jgi:hypothetical protein
MRPAGCDISLSNRAEVHSAQFDLAGGDQGRKGMWKMVIWPVLTVVVLALAIE